MQQTFLERAPVRQDGSEGGAQEPRQRRGSARVLELQPSETAVMHAASRIYAAYLTRGMVAEGSEQQWIQKSIQEAIQLAYWTDQAVQSDDEKRKREAF